MKLFWERGLVIDFKSRLRGSEALRGWDRPVQSEEAARIRGAPGKGGAAFVPLHGRGALREGQLGKVPSGFLL